MSDFAGIICFVCFNTEVRVMWSALNEQKRYILGKSLQKHTDGTNL